MQTFLPYADFKKSVQVLDYRRLGKQRVETFQVLNILLDRTDTKGWRNHPVTLMWSGYESALKLYQNHTIQEWINRGYKNSMKFEEIESNSIVFPTWFGDDRFHISHQSNLLRKDFYYYSQFFEGINPDIPYFWPGNSYVS